MAIVLTDFDKIWASTSPLTPYSFSDANYEEGWNFIGSTPPARQMWDSIQNFNDEKFKYIKDNYLSTAGTVVNDSISESVSLVSGTAKTITSISLDAGVWVVKGRAYFGSAPTADKVFGIQVGTSADTFAYGDANSVAFHTAVSSAFAVQSVGIFSLSATTTMYLCGFSNNNATISAASIYAVRIV